MNIKNAKIKFGLIRQNREAKTIFSNFAWLSALQFATYLFPLITMPYLAKVIGVDGFGKIAFASAIMVWIQTIADWGFNLSATRDVAQNKENLPKVSEIFSNVIWSKCLLMCISLIVLLILIVLIPRFREESDIILISFLMIPGHILFPDWFFQAIERMKYITILNILIKTLFTIAIFVFIKEKEDYILQPLFTSIGYLIAGLIALYFILIKWQIKLKKVRIKIIIKEIIKNTDIFINEILPNLYNSMSVMLLGIFGGSVSTGIFHGGTRLIHLGNQLMLIISRAFFPFLSRRIEKHQTFVKLNIIISCSIAILIFISAPLFVKLFLTSDFKDAIYVTQINSISIVFYAISSAYGKSYLLIIHHEKLLRKITTYCSIFGFIIAWPLVYFYSYIGASLTLTISLGLSAFFNYFFAKQIITKD